MLRQIVRVKWAGDTSEVDIEVPAEVNSSALAEMIAAAMGWPKHKGDMAYQLRATPPGRVLTANESLADAAVWSGSLLEAQLVKSRAPMGRQRSDATEHAVSSALLRNATTGRGYSVNGDHATIGRGAVDIDLQGEEQGGGVSRQHAVLSREGGDWLLSAAQPKTGSRTFVNGQAIGYGSQVRVVSRDTLMFGNVELVFETGD